MRKSIAIDVDSTLNTLDEDWVAAINQDFKTNLTVADMKDWDPNTWKPEGCTDIFEPLKRKGWFRNLGVQPYSQDVVKWLSENYDIYVATAFHPATVQDKYDWIGEHFPMIDQKNIIFINPKYVLNTDYLIDDGPHNIEDFKQKGLLVDAAWNQKLVLAKNQIRVYDWPHIEEVMRDELQEDMYTTRWMRRKVYQEV